MTDGRFGHEVSVGPGKMKIQSYQPPQNVDSVVDTQLIDGTYVMERRKSGDRRRSRIRYKGYERRRGADRRMSGGIDEYA